MLNPEEQTRPSHHGGRSDTEVGAVVGIDLEAGRIAAGDRDPNAVAGVEDEGRGPQLDRQLHGHAGCQQALVIITAPHPCPLDAVEHMMGIAMVFPKAKEETEQAYVTADLSNVEREEIDDFEEIEDIGPIEGAGNDDA